MSEDLLDELEAINSIYGEDTIVRANDTEMDIYILSIPHHDVTLRLSFAPSYPDQPPDILGTETTGETSRKGHGAHVVAQAREALGWTFTPGSVCVFDLLQELENSLQKPNDNPVDLRPVNPLINGDKIMNPPKISNGCHNSSSLFSPPDWSLSEAVTCKKSVFIARACPVSSPAQAHAALANLLANDKRAANATHNINAYRIRSQLMSQTKDGPSEIIYQDCLDDGETAAGGRLLHLLQAMDVWNVFVVITRWYGGLQLGPDRFRIMSQVAREAVIRLSDREDNLTGLPPDGTKVAHYVAGSALGSRGKMNCQNSTSELGLWMGTSPGATSSRTHGSVFELKLVQEPAARSAK